MAPSVHTARVAGNVFSAVFVIGLLVWCFYAPTVSNFENTYERTYQPTDGFYSQRWNLHFFHVGSICFFFLIPITLLWVLGDKEGSRSLSGQRVFRFRILHWIVLSLLFVWFLIAIVFESINLGNANKGDPSNAFNPANDAGWCCIYYTFEVGCFVKAPGCNTPFTTADLQVSGSFIFFYTFLILFESLLIIDAILMWTLIVPAFDANQGQGLNDLEQPLKSVSSQGRSYYSPIPKNPMN
jgi:hypothetical protein